ncbi:MAG: FG-GAP repeat protein [Deltaproteobacteria bacterium]|nr:FG-GAP repeat protein [Deltaproteobacteria bacterium]
MLSKNSHTEIVYEHPADQQNFNYGFEDGSLDAEEGVLSLCATKKCTAQNPYERGYKLGYKKGAKKKGLIDPLIDSPGKTMGSDFNGDGIHDVIIGGYNAEGAGAADAARGEAYIFYGASSLSGTKGVSTADVIIQGKADSDKLGFRVSSAGDVNGDGIDDIIAGAAYNDAVATSSGAAYIFFGSTTLSGTKNLAGSASADVTFLGKNVTNCLLGLDVSGAGDVNGDGFDDVIVGAYSNDATSGEGAAYIFFGAGNLSGTKNLNTTASADVTILGKVSGDGLGAPGVSGAGDINGDGFDDIIVGAYKNDAFNTSSGEAYVFFGASNLSGTKDLDTTASPDVTIQGSETGRTGFSVSGLGDVNGDGLDDIGVSHHGPTGVGEAYIFYGATNISGTKAVASANVQLLGKTGSDSFGISVSGAGDINDDGFDDVIVGGELDDSGSVTNRGGAYVFFGSSALSGTKDLAGSASADVTILGEKTNDYLGESVSGAGDVNADGIPDVIMGARGNDFVANISGAAYIFFGSTTLSGTKDFATTTTRSDVTFTGRAASDLIGKSVSGGRTSGGR